MVSTFGSRHGVRNFSRCPLRRAFLRAAQVFPQTDPAAVDLHHHAPSGQFVSGRQLTCAPHQEFSLAHRQQLHSQLFGHPADGLRIQVDSLTGQFFLGHSDRRAEGHDTSHGVLQCRTTAFAKSQRRQFGIQTSLLLDRPCGASFATSRRAVPSADEQDARQFADWGFDFLKYDWCSYTHIAEGKDPKAKDICFCGKGAPNLESYQRPYRLMGGILKRLPRDVVFNLCQYGMADVWQWGAEVGGHSWRTGDELGAFLNRLFAVALRNAEHRAWSKPGAWNDPDYLQIGFIGDARSNGAPKPCPLTPTEQYSFMSLWCLMAAPLFYSGDMSQLDAFTLNILCNTEVIEVDQDPLGDSARVVVLDDDTFLMVKNMEDGSKVVGLCNRGELSATVAARWSDVGVSGRRVVRDLWRQQDLGQFEGEFRASVPRHGVVLVRLR